MKPDSELVKNIISFILICIAIRLGLYILTS